MRRFLASLLLICFLLLGSGLAEFLHNLDHARSDAIAIATAKAHGLPIQQHPPIHDDTNCEFHAMLHAPALAGGWVPLLICLGLFVAFLSLLSPELIAQRMLARIDCRGPPAC